MNLENKIEAQRKRMEQEKNKLDMLMKKAKIEQRKADNHRKIVVGANFETFLNEPRRYSEEQTRRIMQVAFATKEVKNCMEQIERELARAEEQASRQGSRTGIRNTKTQFNYSVRCMENRKDFMHLFTLGKGELWNRQKSRQRTKNSVRISKRKSEEPPTTWQFISAKRAGKP